MLRMMDIDDICKSLREQAKDKELLANGDADSIFALDAQALREAASVIENAVPRDFHDRCMELAVHRFVTAELKLAQEQAQNRRILANCVPKNRWHDGDERPEKDGYYLAIAIGKGKVPPMQMLLYCKEGGWFGLEILHWMPLPEAPKEAME